jgi:hypothetical protein
MCARLAAMRISSWGAAVCLLDQMRLQAQLSQTGSLADLQWLRGVASKAAAAAPAPVQVVLLQVRLLARMVHRMPRPVEAQSHLQ